MNALMALDAAQAAGVTVKVDGNGLLLEAPVAPPAQVIEALGRHKTEILKLLGATENGWEHEDWRAYFDERAAIAEYDGGFTRSDADLCAFEDCIDHWLAVHPPIPRRADSCLHCELAISAEELTNVRVAGSGGAVKLVHRECAPRWFVLRRLEARRALSWLLAQSRWRA
jgi:hypothetical protein